MINIRKKKNIVMIVFLLLLFLVSNENTLSYLLVKTSPVISVFKPYEYTTGNLIISKKVEHPFGEDYVISDNIEFEFMVDLGSYYGKQVITTSQGDYTADENGIFNLKVKANTSVVLNNIEKGTEVNVEEVKLLDGFTITNKEQKITISSQEESTLEFLSVYKPLVVNGSNIKLYGIKVLEGREWQEGDNFTFKLEYQNEDNEWVKLDTRTITYSKENLEFNEFDFTEIIKTIEFNDAKTYKFRLSEIVGNLENIVYDKTINNFEIIIGDKLMDGALEIQDVKSYQNITVVKEKDNYNINVIFNNMYEVEEDIKIEYEDDKTQSVLLNDNIVVKNSNYDIDTVISNFDGLSDNYTYTIYDINDNVVNTDKVRTGDYIKIIDNGNEYIYNMVLLGDVSGDGEIEPLDYVKIKNHIMKEKLLVKEPYMIAADMSGDGKIEPLDYVKVKNYIINQGGN